MNNLVYRVSSDALVYLDNFLGVELLEYIYF